MANPYLSLESAERLRNLIAEADLTTYEVALLENAVECVSLQVTEPDDYQEVGTSRYGGVPDLPPDFTWPRDSEDRLAVFLMQLNLSKLPKLAGITLPDRGMLYCFLLDDEVQSTAEGDQTPAIACRVVYRDDESLVRMAPPEDAEWVPCYEYYEQMTPYQLTGAVGIVVPGYGSDFLEELGLTSEEEDRYFSFEETSSQVDRQRQAGVLFGQPSCLSGDPREDAFLIHSGQGKYTYDYTYREEHENEIKEGAKAWRTFWVLDSSLKVDVCYGDAGFIEILIHDDDLAAWNLTNLYAHMFSS